MNFGFRDASKSTLQSVSVRTEMQDDILMPEEGVGFLDLGCGNPGTHLSKFSSQTMQSWTNVFYSHLKDHKERAARHIGYSPSCSNKTHTVHAFGNAIQIHDALQLRRSHMQNLEIEKLQGCISLPADYCKLLYHIKIG